jgi:signal peptidase I
VASDAFRHILIGRNPRHTFARVVVLVVAAFLTFRFVLLPVRCYGPSMAPTIEHGSLRLVNRLGCRWTPCGRGEIVALRMAGRRVVYLKRIVGLPGEHLRIIEGIVFVDGDPLYEPYVRHRAAWSLEEVQLGADEYFFIGDNRGMSIQRHDLGRAKVDRVVGNLWW